MEFQTEHAVVQIEQRRARIGGEHARGIAPDRVQNDGRLNHRAVLAEALGASRRCAPDGRSHGVIAGLSGKKRYVRHSLRRRIYMKEAIGKGAASILLAVGLAVMPAFALAQASPGSSPAPGVSPGTSTTTTTTTATSSPAGGTMTTTGGSTMTGTTTGTTTGGGGGSGWWGLIGLVGLLGLFGMGGRRGTTVETYDTTRRV